MRDRTLLHSGVRPAFAALAALTAAGTLHAPTATAEPSREPMAVVWRVDKANDAAEFSGSGFLLGGSGYVLTARHVAEHNPYQGLKVSISSKSADRVPVYDDVTCSDAYDLCILRIVEDDVALAGIAPTSLYRIRCRPLQRQEPVSAYGFLAGDNGIDAPTGSVTTGLIEDGLTLTSVPLEPSMSGGPVFDATGQVIAIVNGGATMQGAIVPLTVATSAISDTGYDCQSGWPQKVEELRAAEVADLKTMNQTVAVALQGKKLLLVPALDAYVRRPGAGAWNAVRKAADIDADQADAAIRSVIAFFARYRVHGSEAVDLMLDSGFAAPPNLETRPELGALERILATLSGKTGAIQEIRDEPVPPSPARATAYRRQMIALVDDIEANLGGLIAAYSRWLHPT